MSVSAFGRYHNVGWDRDEAQATRKQRWALWFVSGETLDFRDTTKSISESRASELIREHNIKGTKSKALGKGNQLQNALFDAAMKKAIQEANKAGDEWVKRHSTPSYEIYHEDDDTYEPVRGVLGDVYIKWPDKRSQFGKFLREKYFDEQYERVHVPHSYIGSREYDLLLACEKAALQVFNEHRILGLKLVGIREGETHIIRL